jgi:hypothetical protein
MLGALGLMSLDETPSRLLVPICAGIGVCLYVVGSKLVPSFCSGVKSYLQRRAQHYRDFRNNQRNRRESQRAERLYLKFKPQIDSEPANYCHDCKDGRLEDERFCGCPVGLRLWMLPESSGSDG